MYIDNDIPNRLNVFSTPICGGVTTKVMYHVTTRL